MKPTSARGAVGYGLLQIDDPLPLSPAAAAMAVALRAWRPSQD